jgi:hypothetical protein
MKKALLLVVLLVAFSATAYAQDVKLDFRASGFIDAVSEYWRNAGNNSGAIFDVTNAALRPHRGLVPGGGGLGFSSTGFAFNRKHAYMESRARLKFDAVMGKELSGTIFFEFDSARWGDFRGGNAGRPSDRNAYGAWNGDAAAAEVKNIYIDAALPYLGIPVPMQVRVGLQPLGIRPNLLVFTDGMGIVGSLKLDPVNIQPIWFKAIEGKDFVADDVDVWGLHGNAKISTFTLGAYALYYNMNTYPLNHNTSTPFLDSSFKANTWWAGVYADGKAGPVNVNFDFIYDRGKVKWRGTPSTFGGHGGESDVKYRGWMGYLKIDYPFDMFNFGVVGMYASGADANDTGPSGLPGSLTATGEFSHKVTSFVVPPGSESGAIFGESLVLYSSWVNRGGTGIANTINVNQLSRGGTGGTWMAKLYGSYKAAPWYKITLAGLYIGDTTKHGNTFGDARVDPTDPSSRRKNSSTIGWEFDLYNEFQIYKNLKFTAAGGVLIAKDALKFNDQSTGTNKKPSTPWIITTNLTYSF